MDAHQQAAVAHDDGPALVLAGPGSGKTAVIVERTVRLIGEKHARSDELLVLTFSRKAASDLRERIAARLQRSYASFPITTFHAFCLSILTRDAAQPPRLVAAATATGSSILFVGVALAMRPSGRTHMTSDRARKQDQEPVSPPLLGADAAGTASSPK